MSVCTTSSTYDAFGRVIRQDLPNGAHTEMRYLGPLVTEAHDANDTAGNTTSNSAFYDTPGTVHKDGHGRLVMAVSEFADQFGGNRRSD